jgi:hypothetical protein
MNKLSITVAAFCSILFAGAMTAGTASAAPIGVHASADQSVAQQVQYRRGWRRGGVWVAPGVAVRTGGCARARRICASRWGWGGPRFRRCMWNRGC